MYYLQELPGKKFRLMSDTIALWIFNDHGVARAVCRDWYGIEPEKYFLTQSQCANARASSENDCQQLN
ncbi:MAG: hypothetical protein OEY36_00415 [Gammaproteobacteria bacterium]|nr:hypothetical protein [Gammaproteobacteria bacterium]